MKKISIAGIAVVLSLLGFGSGTKTISATLNSSKAEASSWVSYHNGVTGLSFEHPSDLRIVERNPRSFGLPDAEEITDLVGDTSANSDAIVLRFIVNRGETTPEMAAKKARAIEDAHSAADDPRQSVTSMKLDGHEALTTVDCGHAACHWAVDLLQPRDCVILSLLGGADAAEASPPPHDGVFPVLSIIETVHFVR